MAEESGDIYSQGIAYASHGLSCLSKGYPDESEKYLLKSLDCCERSNLQAWKGAARFCLGEFYREKGNFTQSKEQFEKAARCWDKSQILPSISNLAQIGLERSKVMNNERDIDLKTVFIYSKKNGMKIVEGWFARLTSEILREIDDQGFLEAEAQINGAIEADIRNGTTWSLARDYLSYAELLIKEDDRFKAKENLGKAIETFKECGADGWVEKAEKKLAEIA